MRKGFTLIELLVSISILSIMMIFLYKSYASLNTTNNFYETKVNVMQSTQLKKRVIYLDFALKLDENVSIRKQNPQEDVVFFQSANSVHKRFNPYIAYLVKNEKLYRLESLKKFKEYPLSQEDVFSVDDLGEVKSFRVYSSSKKIDGIQSELFLVHIDFKEQEDILLKIKALNEY